MLSACLLQLLSVEWVCTYLFTLAFKEKCQGKWERMSDSGARHLSPDLQPLCSGSMGYILLAFAPVLNKQELEPWGILERDRDLSQ